MTKLPNGSLSGGPSVSTAVGCTVTTRPVTSRIIWGRNTLRSLLLCTASQSAVVWYMIAMKMLLVTLAISFCVADYKLVDREDFPVVAECFWNAEAMEVNAWSVYDSRGAFSKYVRSICVSSYGGAKHRTEHLRIMARWSFNGKMHLTFIKILDQNHCIDQSPRFLTIKLSKQQKMIHRAAWLD